MAARVQTEKTVPVGHIAPLRAQSDKNSRGYSPLYEQKLDPKNQLSGDTAESIGLWGERAPLPPAGTRQPQGQR